MSNNTAKIVNLPSYLKQTCISFGPYFQFYKNTLYVIDPTPTKPFFHAHSRRNNCIIEKQLMHMRTIVDEYVDHDLIAQLIVQAESTPLQIKKYGNRCVLMRNILYYCHGKHQIRQINVQDIRNVKQLNNKNILCNINDQILEIVGLRNQLAVRIIRSFFIINVSTKQISQLFRFQEEILSLATLIQKKQIVVSTYQQNKTSFYKINSERNEQKLFAVPSLIISSFFRTNNQMLLVSRDFIYFKDLRQKQVQFIQIENKKQGYSNYSAINFSGGLKNTSLFAVSESINVKIFDIRKTSQVIKNIPHHCQARPPTILQYHDFSNEQIVSSESLRSLLGSYSSNKTLSTSQPVLTAFTSYSFSNTIKLNLNNMQSASILNFQLLFDSGKIYQGMYNIGLACCLLQNKKVCFVVDNCGGVSLINLEQSNQDMLNLKNNIRKQQTEIFYFSNKKWVQKAIRDPYVKKNKNQLEVQLPILYESQFSDAQLQLQSVAVQKNIRFSKFRQLFQKLHEKKIQFIQQYKNKQIQQQPIQCIYDQKIQKK